MTDDKVTLAPGSTEVLINRVLATAAQHGCDSLPFFGCVICGHAQHLSTHVVPGYGNVCSPHSDMYDTTVPEPWAAEGAELHRRGIRRL